MQTLKFHLQDYGDGFELRLLLINTSLDCGSQGTSLVVIVPETQLLYFLNQKNNGKSL